MLGDLGFPLGVIQTFWNQTVAVVVQLCCCAAHLPSRVRLFVTLWAIARWAPLSFTVSQNLLRLVSIELVMPSNITLQLYKCTESH